MQLILVLLSSRENGRIVVLGGTIALIDKLITAALRLFGDILVGLELFAALLKLFLGLFKLGTLVLQSLLFLVKLALTAAYFLFKLTDLLFTLLQLRFCIFKLRLAFLSSDFALLKFCFAFSA